MKLIVGLGNPGKSYENTRHNIGFMILDNINNNANWKQKFDGLIIKDDDTLYLKPQTFMNNSGFSVKKVVDFYKIKSEDILVIHDDLDLNFDDFKLKTKSSSGGHNGIKSIISCLGTNEFLRLKIGIGNPRVTDTKDYVLGKFNNSERNLLNDKYKFYEEIIKYFCVNDVESTISKYNTLR